MRLVAAAVVASALVATALAPHMASAASNTAASPAPAAWTIQHIPGPTSGMNSISCPAATACLALGTSALIPSFGFADWWNGKTWTAQPIAVPSGATTSELAGVACTSTSACTVVGQYDAPVSIPLVERWNGATWVVQLSPNPGGAGQLHGVSCPAATDCTAVGSSYDGSAIVPLAEQWNGVTWTAQSAPNPIADDSTLNSVSCSSPSACTAVGVYFDASKLEHMFVDRWNGAVWELQPVPSPAGFSETWLSSVACAAVSGCTAVGWEISTTQTLALSERWNGTTWSIETTPTGLAGELTGVTCQKPSECTAVGMYQVVAGRWLPLAERWSSGAWTVKSIPIPIGKWFSELNAVACPSASQCESVGVTDTAIGRQFNLVEGNGRS